MKKTGQFLFETKLKWQEDTKGFLTSRAIADPVRVSSPKNFEGKQENMWSAEHLLISAVSTGFMTTFMYYAKKAGLPVTDFECEVIGKVELNNEKLKFTHINVYPIISIEKQEWTDKATELVELTKHQCLIAKTLNPIIYYHPTIELKKKTDENKEQMNNKKKEPII